ncbi:two-component response regulator, partial [Candidatus Gastranaerophilus sp. (ex Termes propinquus)]
MLTTKSPTKIDPIRVIIVEDYKLTRVGLRYALNEFEHIDVVCEAENGEKGIEMVAKETPDVVLMDLGLPGINGLEATMAIKENHPDIKIVMLTSHEREDEVLASLGAGATAYCLKDIDPKTLSEVIKNVAQGACWIDPNVAKLALKLFPKPENAGFLSNSEVSDTKSHLTERETEVLKLLVMGK